MSKPVADPIPTNVQALGLVALGAMAISWAAPLVKVIEAAPSTIGFYRLAFATLSLVPFAFMALRTKPRPKSYNPLFWAVLSGIVFGFDLALFHRAILLTGAGLATLLANTQIFWVAIISGTLLKEAPPKNFLMWSLVAIAGVALLTVPGLLNQTLDPTGILMGVGTAFFYASYILSLRQSQSVEGAWPISVNLVISCLFGAITLFSVTLFTNESTAFPDFRNLMWLLVLGLAVHVGGWALISKGMPQLPARISSMTILLQPVLTTVWGVAFFGERFGVFDAVGSALTLVAIYAVAVAGQVKSTSKQSGDSQHA
jgi:drug/metabolite transporter (DMT)-like permease